MIPDIQRRLFLLLPQALLQAKVWIGLLPSSLLVPDTYVVIFGRFHPTYTPFMLIVSEFALVLPATHDQQVAFLKQAMSFLDGASYVTYYTVFGASLPSKISANTSGGEVGTGLSLYNNNGSLSANSVAYHG
ncbi:unnamed protein product [Rhizoctonia solani]|uniref:Asl1-like glycosyl hydrolase catalytic domain-containing protein n=1 Tax=Rhizoctonia solani TaxID=456999 RepID=A0A8H3A4H4_9AGAM|nr:unnamed protein product [Rhizoctonia solani]